MVRMLQLISLHHLWIPIVILFTLFAIICLLALLIQRLAAEQLAIYAYLRTIRKKLTLSMKVYHPKTTPSTYETRDSHLLILGLPGAGKTKELERYQYQTAQGTRQIVFGQNRIPILIPMKYFDGFLSTYQLETDAMEEAEQPIASILFQYLLESSTKTAKKQNPLRARDEVFGIYHLHDHLLELAQEGRLLLLCDGLNELSPTSLQIVCDELAQIMQETTNRVIMTCRELDFSEQESLQQLVPKDQIEVIAPLEQGEVINFATHYLGGKYGSKKLELQQAIIQQLHTTSLHYDYTNPFILVTLIETLLNMNSRQRQNIHSRGMLLKISVEQMMEKEPIGPEEKFTSADVHSFLSEVACVARKNNQRNAIQLKKRAISAGELQSILRIWLDENTSEEIILHKPYLDEMIPHYLKYAQRIGLLTISSHGVLSFKHELIAEYFVAEYLSTLYHLNPAEVPFWQDMFHGVKDVGTWSEPVAIWAGIEEDPILLATHLVAWAERLKSHPAQHPIDMFNVLLISLSCYGVIWSSSVVNKPNSSTFPANILSLLENHLSSEQELQALALRFKRCADEGGGEVYRALLPVLNSIKGLDGLWLHLLQIDEQVVSHLLFNYLVEIIGQPAYMDQVQALQYILGNAGKLINGSTQESRFILGHAIRFSDNTPNNTIDMRVFGITILGFIQDTSNIDALIHYLHEAEQKIYAAAMISLVQFGPEFTIEPLTKELQQTIESLKLNPQNTESQRVLWCILQMLEGILTIHKEKLSLRHYGNIIATIMLFLSSNYIEQVQKKAKDILRNEAASIKNQGDWKGKKVIDQLLARLDTADVVELQHIQELLRESAAEATPQELEYLRTASDIARLRLIEVVAHVRDLRALHTLVTYLNSASPIQEKVKDALKLYAHYKPESIPLLINELSSSQRSDMVAQEIANILEKNGTSGVPYIAAKLLHIEQRRIHILVGILRSLGDKQAIPQLIELLRHTVVTNITLAVYIVQVLADLPDERAVTPLLDLLASPEPKLHMTATQTLSKLGDIALPKLLLALDTKQETITTQRVSAALVKMQPFPKEKILAAFKLPSDALGQHIMQVFQQSASEELGAFLVSHLFHTDERVRTFVRKTLSTIDPRLTAKALVEALDRPGWQTVIAPYLHNRSAAIFFLIQALGHDMRYQPAYDILLDFDSQQVISHLIPGLENSKASKHTRRLIAALVTRDNTLLTSIIHLFNPSISGLYALSEDAYKTLIEVLTRELGDISLLKLIESLREKELITGSSDTLVVLARQQEKTENVLQALFDALADKSLRLGVEQTLIKIGEPALNGITQLLTNENQAVVASAEHILQTMDKLALPVIYQLYHKDNDQQLISADTIFRGILSKSLASGIVTYLAPNDTVKLEIALYLLYKRIDDEDRSGKVIMLQEMLAQAQQASTTHMRVRILSALLLFNGSTTQRTSIANLIIAFMSGQSKYHKEFIRILPFLGEDAITPLKQVVEGFSSGQLREDATGMLALITRHESIVGLVDDLAKKHVPQISSRTQLLADPLQLRALGGLLASGNYDAQTLQDRRNSSQLEISAEFYEVLLGVRNKPTIRVLNDELNETKMKLQRANSQITSTELENRDLKAQEESCT